MQTNAVGVCDLEILPAAVPLGFEDIRGSFQT